MRTSKFDATIRMQEAVVSSHALECRDESLFDTQRRELTQLLEQRRTLCHDLSNEGNGMRGLFAHERAILRGTEEQRLRLLVSTRVRRVYGVRRETFGTKSFTARGYPRNEAPTCAHSTAQDHAAANDDEHSVGSRTAFVNLKT